MTPLTISRAVILVLLLVAIAAADDAAPSYQHGTIVTKDDSGRHPLYELKGPEIAYRISDCSGDFQTGQTVDYRARNGKIYVRRDSGEDYTCKAKIAESVTAPTYQQGTITGWNTRVDTPGNSVRRTKVYELKGFGMIYQIDDCGSFQAGQFSAGQTVDYRVDESIAYDKRIYIRRENNKEYSCRMEGAKPVENAAPSTATPSAKP